MAGGSGPTGTIDDRGLQVGRRRWIPWSDVARVVPLQVVGRTRPTASLALLHDGTAIACKADAAAMDQRRVVPAPLDPPSSGPEPGATSLFPVRQPPLASAQLVLGGVAVAEIFVLLWINDLAQHRVPSGLVGGMPLVLVSLYLATGLRRSFDRLGVEVDERCLRVRARRRDSMDVPWSEIERFVCFPGAAHGKRVRVAGRVALIRDGAARELRVPSVNPRRKELGYDDATRVVSELSLALTGRFLPRRPGAPHRRRLEAACLSLAIAAFAVAAAGELQVAARANEINGRARTVEARVLAVVDAEGRPQLTLGLAGETEPRIVDFDASDPDPQPGDVVTVEVDPVDGGGAWFATSRWPPGARDESIGGLLTMLLVWIAGPLLVALAYLLHRRATATGASAPLTAPSPG